LDNALLKNIFSALHEVISKLNNSLKSLHFSYFLGSTEMKSGDQNKQMRKQQSEATSQHTRIQYW